MRRLPPLNAIRAFECAARHVSFTRAASELHVTHGAISRQVALLEEWFGLKLFRRAAAHLSLTEAGISYYRDVTALLDRLALATADVKRHASPSILRINAPPTFAMRWLLRRLSRFQMLRPDIEIKLTTSLEPLTSVDAPTIDISIRGDAGEIPGWQSTEFMTELIAPICHRRLMPCFENLDDLGGQCLISYSTEPYSWDQWLSQVGHDLRSTRERLKFEQMYFALQAVQDGLGIGLFPMFLVIDELLKEQLCIPFGDHGLRRRSYRSVVRSDVETLPAIMEFQDWLAREGQETERTTSAWMSSREWQ